MVVGRGLMNMGRISINPTITTLLIAPDDLVCDGYAYFSVTVLRVDMDMPNPTGDIRIINIDTGNSVVSGTLTDGYVIVNKQLSNGVYNFAALYNGVINSFASSQSETIGYNVNFIMTFAHIVGPTTFRSDDGARYEATVDLGIIEPFPTNISVGTMLFMASDGYQNIILGFVDVINNFAAINISGGNIDVGEWIISAQYISNGICYASSDTDTLNVTVS